MLCLMHCSLGCQGTLLIYVELAVNRHSQILFFRAVLPICGTWYLPSFNFMALIVQFSMAFRFLCKVSHPSRESTASCRWVSSANLLRTGSIPAFRLLIKFWTELTLELSSGKHHQWLAANQTQLNSHKTLSSTIEPVLHSAQYKTVYLIVGQFVQKNAVKK